MKTQKLAQSVAFTGTLLAALFAVPSTAHATIFITNSPPDLITTAPFTPAVATYNIGYFDLLQHVTGTFDWGDGSTPDSIDTTENFFGFGHGYIAPGTYDVSVDITGYTYTVQPVFTEEPVFGVIGFGGFFHNEPIMGIIGFNNVQTGTQEVDDAPSTVTDSFQVLVTPEPASLGILGTAAASLFLRRRRMA